MYIKDYDTGGWFDEVFDDSGKPRPEAQLLLDIIRSQPEGEFERLQETANAALVNLGITFNVYSDGAGVERVLPFDIFPRVVRNDEWDNIERGLKQRIYALNLFLQDVYNDAKILRDGVVPKELVLSAPSYREACRGLTPPAGIWCHITGTDLVRDGDGRFYVLEDNLRCPSGVSYVLENRRLMKQTFPDLFASSLVRSVDDYPSKLLDVLHYISPRPGHVARGGAVRPACTTRPTSNTPTWRSRWASSWSKAATSSCRTTLCTCARRGASSASTCSTGASTTTSWTPRSFGPDSLLGVPGLMGAYEQGNLGLANAPGTGVADDKVIYAFVPEIIRYYLGEEPILDNVPTYLCWRDEDMAYVLEHMAELVVKPANESGGYGLLVGPQATAEELDEFTTARQSEPAQLHRAADAGACRARLSSSADHFEGRHVDLRPYILYGRDIYVLPGGLTRVALKKGSLVVNSSQGGGSKDTWVVSSRAR